MFNPEEFTESTTFFALISNFLSHNSITASCREFHATIHDELCWPLIIFMCEEIASNRSAVFLTSSAVLGFEGGWMCNEV